MEVPILTGMIRVNNFWQKTFCLHLETVFTVQWTDRELHHDNHLKLNISKTNELVVDYKINRI